jgi:hypothetical protein
MAGVHAWWAGVERNCQQVLVVLVNPHMLWPAHCVYVPSAVSACHKRDSRLCCMTVVNGGRYGDGTVRVTVEENIIFPFVPNNKVDEMLQEPIFQK